MNYQDLPVEIRYLIYTYLNIRDLRNILRTSTLEQQIAGRIFIKLTTIEPFINDSGVKLIPYILTKNKFIGGVICDCDEYLNKQAVKLGISIVFLQRGNRHIFVDIYDDHGHKHPMLDSGIKWRDTTIKDFILDKLSKHIPHNNYLLYSNN